MINTQALYDLMASSFGVSSSSPRFSDRFRECVNIVSKDLVASTGMDDIDDITAISGNIDVDQQYYTVYYNGVRYYLQNCKEWGIEPDEKAEARYSRALGKAQALYLIDDPPAVRDYDPDA